MSKKNSKSWNLPPGKEYHIWSKAILRQKVGHDKALNSYLVEDENYCINQQTIALYEFQNEPLLGKFKSVIFDCQEGIVLSRNSSQAMFTAFGKKCLLAGLEFQREFAQKINLKGHNIIATGRMAYFSMRSYNSGSIDWISLHQMAEFQPLSISAIAFKSITCGSTSYVFAFYNCSRYIRQRLCNSLVYNHILFKLAAAHLEQSLGWQVKQVQGQLLIDQSEYFHPHISLTELSLKEILVDLLDKKQKRYGRCLAEVYELPQLTEFHQTVHQASQRPDTLY